MERNHAKRPGFLVFLIALGFVAAATIWKQIENGNQMGRAILDSLASSSRASAQAADLARETHDLTLELRRVVYENRRLSRRIANETRRELRDFGSVVDSVQMVLPRPKGKK